MRKEEIPTQFPLLSKIPNSLPPVLTSKQIDMIISQRRTSQHHPMRMEARTRNRTTPRMLQEATVRLNAIQKSPVHIEHADIMPITARRKYRRVFMYAECAQGVARSGDGANRLIHTDIPELDLAVSGP